ncbi:uncharacterized protein LOC143248137 [Tachypleus tridentatus]|uniref:uncharacterized protein LOC143248137 n=1 Tax=Tachypleus tridentatus TaxID=6853 RepID=UPI003FD0E89C
MFCLSTLDEVRFKDRKGNFISVIPVSVEFGKLLREEKNTRNSSAFSGWKKHTYRLNEDQLAPLSDLFYATVALYSTCLKKVTLTSIYKTICAEGARTFILLRDKQEILQKSENCRTDSEIEVNNNSMSATQFMKISTLPEKDETVVQLADLSNDTGNDSAVLLNVGAKEHDSINVLDLRTNWLSIDDSTSGHACDKKVCGDLWLSQLSSPSTCESVKLPSCGSDNRNEYSFSDVFSDSENERDINSDTEEEVGIDDFSRGLQIFFNAAAQRKHERRNKSLEGAQMGMENRVMAAATYKKNYRIPGSKIVSLMLLSVRKKYRKCGLGNFLLKKLKSPSVVGPYDALVVRADNSAVQFFCKTGFTDDVILNSKFREVDETWNGCTLMTYLPPFDGHYPPLPGITEWNRPEAMAAMENEIEKWHVIKFSFISFHSDVIIYV